MLKIKDNVDIKELKKFGIYPRYECDQGTGKTRIYELNTKFMSIKHLRFSKKKKFAIIKYLSENEYILEVPESEKSLLDLDILYDLIQANLIEKI